MYALDDVGDALEATRAFLLPFDLRRWLALALVTLFLGGVAGPVGTGGSTGGGTDGAELSPPADPSGLVWLIVAALVAAVVLALAFAVVRGVMDFVLVQSLREERVEIRRFWSAHWPQGLRLFAFRLAVDVVTLVVVAVPLALVVLSAPFGATPADSLMLFLGILLLIPVLLVVPATATLLKGLTTAFVVPVMILEGGGVLDGWRRFWPTLRAEWKEYVGYVVVNLVLAFGTSIAFTVGAAVGAVVLAVPFLVLFAAGFALRTVSEPVGLAALAVVGLGYGLALLVVVALVKAPLVTFLRYYALFVLGDTDPDVDPIPERRRLVRAGDDGEPAGGDA